jgi:hypothetical protein
VEGLQDQGHLCRRDDRTAPHDGLQRVVDGHQYCFLGLPNEIGKWRIGLFVVLSAGEKAINSESSGIHDDNEVQSSRDRTEMHPEDQISSLIRRNLQTGE